MGIKVGIDLGTTFSAVAMMDEKRGSLLLSPILLEKESPLRLFSLPKMMKSSLEQKQRKHLNLVNLAAHRYLSEAWAARIYTAPSTENDIQRKIFQPFFFDI